MQELIFTLLLLIALTISLYTDLKERRILNAVTFPTIIIGIIIHTYSSGLTGLAFSAKGMGIGIALLLIPFIMGGMGAGDVKLLGAIGALKGSVFLLHSFVFTCLAGGLIALFVIIKSRKFKETKDRLTNLILFKNINSLSKDEYHHSFPYGVAIFIGTITALLRGGIV